MLVDIVTVFPEYFDVVNLSLMGKARAKGLLDIRVRNLRDWTHDVHHSVDDTPVGGGAGMVMKPEVWGACLDDLLAEGPSPVLVLPNPSAPLFTQRQATELSHVGRLVFGCGRYEGYDARIPEYYRARGVDVREYSIGDYVLNGGEVAVTAMLEAIVRLLPGFMGNPDSIVEESYTGRDALLEHPQYTKPAVWRGMAVPDVLLGGDHARVDRFRRDEALQRTSAIRPDLIAALDCTHLDKADRGVLENAGWDVSGEHPTPAAPERDR
ncbi:tRNA (guanosine(37)-N1)-methyltransferase TrmD [uncultured Bifidobacterium sp.]|uniref:tRNA (guanosine(37)-N1)-methyltransferase TrmD n=1 Tax=uncultured Bifidobacterium sp. TaxID=165187 RepID=UPI0028DC146B|nr:tRNA (guanosine(37)-N1)-methyltransferase TrmD [uncultured Bifidobacterium sp.]